MTTEADYSVWKQSPDRYQAIFRTKNTWNLLRQEGSMVDWHKGLWFEHHTPKFAFFTWLAIQNRLTKGDRMLAWNTSATS